MKLFKKSAEKQKDRRVPDPEGYKSARMYDYSTPESRVATATWLFEQAKNERTAVESRWVKCNDYYNFDHHGVQETTESMAEMGLDWSPAVVPDCFIQVESQIVPDIPMPEFRGRDNYGDSEKAKERELGVKYLIEANRLEDKNTSNERRLRKLGDAFWKAYYDEDMPFGDRRGNIRVRDVAPEDIYPDPTAGPEGLQAGEYLCYVYTMHKLKFWRLFNKELTKNGLALDDVTGNEFRVDDDLLAPYSMGTQFRDDMVQVMEFWFKQPWDSKDAPAGSIACSLQIYGTELRYIPNYWKKVGRQCNLFPFVHYWCIRDETQFWNKSELESLIPTVDAADRELTMGLLNDAMMANDIILVEEGALAAGSEVVNTPGAVVEMKQGRLGGMARLGGLHTGQNSLSMVEWLMKQIQRTNRNYDENNGMATTRVTTASGLMQVRGDAESQQKLKRADRDAGFERLYELMDWLLLEFFDDDRLLFIGAKKEGEEPQMLSFNSDNYAETVPAVVDPVTGEVLQEERKYFPRIDVTVSAGGAFSKSPAATVEILDKLAAVPVTAENWKLLSAQLEILDIPQKQAIVEEWKSRFQPAVPPEVTQALADNPMLLQTVMEVISGGIAPEEMPAEAPAQAELPPELLQMMQSGGGMPAESAPVAVPEQLPGMVPFV